MPFHNDEHEPSRVFSFWDRRAKQGRIDKVRPITLRLSSLRNGDAQGEWVVVGASRWQRFRNACRRFFLLTAFCSSFFFAEGAVAETPSRFVRLKTQYDGLVETLQRRHSIQISSLTQAYTNALARLEAKLQAAGNLDAMLLLRAEEQRYTMERDMPDTALAPSVEGLYTIQTHYRDKLFGHRSTYHLATLKVSEVYIARLLEMERNLTKAGDIETAVLVNEERHEIEDMLAHLQQRMADEATASRSMETETATVINKPVGIAKIRPDVQQPVLDLLIRDALILELQLTEGAGAVLKNPYGRNGEAKNAVWAPVREGADRRGLQFQGNGLAKVDNYDKFKKVAVEGTLEVWLKPALQELAAVVSKGDDDIFHDDFSLWLDGMKPALYFNWPNRSKTDPGAPYYVAPHEVLAAEWVHIVWTWNADVVRLFIDGEFAADFKSLELPNITRTAFHLACNPPGGDEYYSGMLGHVAIYEKAMRDDVIARMYGRLANVFKDQRSAMARRR